MEISVNLNTDTYCKILLIATLGLLSMHLGLNYYNHQVAETSWLLHQLFELDEENNIPTWFSSFLLLNNAFFLWIIAESHYKGFRAAENSVDHYRIHWRVLAFGFLVLAIDETAGLHETFHTAIDTNWAIFGGILVALVGLAFIPFLLSLPRTIAAWFVLAGAIFIGGAIGIEYLSKDMDEDSMSYGFAVAVEEGMEMLGALLFLFIILREMKKGQTEGE
ncbi:MAG: hypothetical protein JKY88_12150 [Pseudomonadales bacterium]|nr:hypothetical protein [Pseudomonadales bacterium]